MENKDKFQEIVNKWIGIARDVCKNHWLLQNDYFREALWAIYDRDFKYTSLYSSVTDTDIEVIVNALYKEWFRVFRGTAKFDADFESKIRHDVEKLFVDEEDIKEKVAEIIDEISLIILKEKFGFIKKFVKNAILYTKELIKYIEQLKNLVKNDELEKKYFGCSFYELLEKVKEDFINKTNFSEEYEKFSKDPITRAIGGNYYDYLLKRFRDTLVYYLTTKNLKREEIDNLIRKKIEKLAQEYKKENYYLDIMEVKIKVWEEIVRDYEEEVKKYFENKLRFLFI
jgi:hypothetical protein